MPRFSFERGFFYHGWHGFEIDFTDCFTLCLALCDFLYRAFELVFALEKPVLSEAEASHTCTLVTSLGLIENGKIVYKKGDNCVSTSNGKWIDAMEFRILAC